MRTYRAALLAAAFTFSFLPTALAAKKHPHLAKPHANKPQGKPGPARAAARKAKALHLARLAAQQKAAWRAHLAKVRELPRAERVALKRHERHLKQAPQKPQGSAASLAKQARAAKRAWRAHLAKVADMDPRQRRLMRRHDARVAALKDDGPARKSQVAAPSKSHIRKIAAVKPTAKIKVASRRAKAPARSAHEIRLAKQQAARQARAAHLQAAHQAALAKAQAAHQAALARQQAVAHARLAQHQARLAQQQAAYNARLRAQQRLLAQKALNHQARLAKTQAAHNARLAAQRAHYAALHGDNSGGRSIHFWQTAAAGVPVKVITVDLNDSNVKVSAVMALRGNGTAEPFRQMIERARPNVAVTGTFFSLDNLRPVGDIVIDGSLVHFGGMGTALCVTPDNRAEMVACQWGRHHDWSPYDFVVACGPRLLRRGRLALDPHGERFRDKHMLAPNSRIAVGITEGNKLVFAMTHKPIYLGRLAKVMRSLGASEAMNLDAGTSTGFYYNGATLAHPGRQLTNMIVVYGRRERYERSLDQLVPASYRRMPASYRRTSHRFSRL